MQGPASAVSKDRKENSEGIGRFLFWWGRSFPCFLTAPRLTNYKACMLIGLCILLLFPCELMHLSAARPEAGSTGLS
jgi:hypothetical protein